MLIYDLILCNLIRSQNNIVIRGKPIDIIALDNAVLLIFIYDRNLPEHRLALIDIVNTIECLLIILLQLHMLRRIIQKNLIPG